MGNPNQMDWGGVDLVVKSITLSDTPAGAQTTSNILTAASQTIAGAKTFSSNTVLGAGTRPDLDSSAATLVSNAATITTYAAKITTESLTTAHTASATFVITKTGVAAGDFVSLVRSGGSNTGGIPVIQSVACTTDTVTIVLKNEALTTNAFNGTFIFDLIVYKA